MIPLTRFPEPDYFDKEVRQRGLAFLRSKKIELDVAAPPKTEFKPFWAVCKKDLYSLFCGYCAYTCFHIHETTGATTVEHIMPKRLFPKFAYEWNNYCLACARINSKKGEQIDLLNPFDVTKGLFILKLETGFILANTAHHQFDIADKTITNLDLNNQTWCDARKKCIYDYIENRKNGLCLRIAEQRLKEASVFVWLEAGRQGYLI